MGPNAGRARCGIGLQALAPYTDASRDATQLVCPSPASLARTDGRQAMPTSLSQVEPTNRGR